MSQLRFPEESHGHLHVSCPRSVRYLRVAAFFVLQVWLVGDSVGRTGQAGTRVTTAELKQLAVQVKAAEERIRNIRIESDHLEERHDRRGNQSERTATRQVLHWGSTETEFLPVPADKIPEVLTMLADRIRSNYERIETWQGEADVIMETFYEGPAAERIFRSRTDGAGEIPQRVKRHTEGRIRFALHIAKDLLYVENYRDQPSQYTDIELGRDLGSKSIPVFERAIVTPEYHLHCTPDRRLDGIYVSQRVVKQPRKKSPDCQGCEDISVFDPRELFGLPLQPVWEIFPRILEVIAERREYSVDGYALAVEERTQGEVTEYRINKPGKLSLQPGKLGPQSYLFKTRILSGAKGFNAIVEQVAHPDGKLISNTIYDYELVDGVYLPSSTTRQSFRLGTGELTYENRTVFKNLGVNRPIAPETFTYKNLGLEDGDRFIDKIENAEFIYQDGELVPASRESSHMFRRILPYTAELNVNGDCCVDFRDIAMLAGHWLQAG